MARKSSAPTKPPEGYRWCPWARHFVLEVEFSINSKGVFSAYCNSCRQVYDRDRYLRIKEEENG